jgi:hypothetical protein
VDVIAHGLWAAAAATAAKRAGARVQVRSVACWAMFPDVLAFGPSVALGLWLRLAGGVGHQGSLHGGHLPHAHIGLPLYPIGHSLIVFAAVLGLSALVTRRLVVGLSGWLLHILIDIPTHSFRYYATRFLWPLSNYAFDGVPWWTPWSLGFTYGGLALAYLLLWKKGWLSPARSSPAKAGPQGAPVL